jgi:hypothetical protein
VTDSEVPTPITGTDGKTYTNKPTKPRRSPITDQARNAGWELRKAVERIERIAADDRFNSQIETVTSHLRGHLTNAVEVCQELLDRINSGGTPAKASRHQCVNQTPLKEVNNAIIARFPRS